MAQEKRKPDYKARVKVGEFWHDAGAAWNNDKGIGVKLTMLPVGEWDGSLLLLPPKDDE